MMGWYGGWGWAGWVAMSVTMLLFWGLVVTGVIVVVRLLRSGPHESGGRGTALRLLDERFARGEIDEEDYRKRRELLSGR